MARINPGNSGNGNTRTRLNINPRELGQKLNPGEQDGLEGTHEGRLGSLFGDKVTIGSVEGVKRKGEIGGRVSAVDANLDINDSVSLGASGPSLEGQGQLIKRKDFQAARLGLGASVGGVAANGQLGGEKNNLRATVGVGAGAGFDVGASRTVNPDNSVTTSLDLDASIFGRVAFGVTMTTKPPMSRAAVENMMERLKGSEVCP